MLNVLPRNGFTDPTQQVTQNWLVVDRYLGSNKSSRKNADNSVRPATPALR